MTQEYSTQQIDDLFLQATIKACIKYGNKKWCPRKVEKAVIDGRLNAYPMVDDWPEDKGAWSFHMAENSWDELRPSLWNRIKRYTRRFAQKTNQSK